VTKKLDLSKPPFQTDEDPPRKAELLRQGIRYKYEMRDVWLITTPEGIQFPVMRFQDGSAVETRGPSIVNAPRSIKFWITLNGFGTIEYTRTEHQPNNTREWHGPFYMDENGNPVSGDD
jgi:hypothetical protein